MSNLSNKIAFVFPGQGSQSVGMLQDMGAIVIELFNQASDVVGYDLWELTQEDPKGQLNETEFTQPALLTASIAVWRESQARGIEMPSIVAGHSLGEYSALVAADALGYEDALALVQERGRLMQSAVPIGEGGMAAVLGLADDLVVLICKQCSEEGSVVQAANFNSPGQVVIAGHLDAIARAGVALKEGGAKRVMPLSVSAPFHSEEMKPAAMKMADVLAQVKIRTPKIPIIQNVNGKIESNPDRIRSNLVEQMYGAVLWTSTIQLFVALGVNKVVECGPGKVLATLNRRIDKSLSSFQLNSLDTIEQTIADLKI
ncbi:MAG: ACP S-malonyltransferase [Pseudomonadales bacterium]|nr:ACP S-malonyltransferase [Pseudomonadales bacterium]